MWLRFTWSVFNWQIRRWLLLRSSDSKHHELVSDRSLKSAWTKRDWSFKSGIVKGWNFQYRHFIDRQLRGKLNFPAACTVTTHVSLFSLSLSVCCSALALLHPRICRIPLLPSLRDIPVLAPLTASLWLFLVHCRLKRRNISVCVPLCFMPAPFTQAFILTVSCWPVCLSLLQTENRPSS